MCLTTMDFFDKFYGNKTTSGILQSTRQLKELLLKELDAKRNGIDKFR